MSDTELIIDAQLESSPQPTLIPRVNSVSLARVDEVVDAIEAHAAAFVCTNAQDYEQGGLQIARIRKFTPLYEQVFKPLKDWYQARKEEAAAEETSRTSRLNTAKAAYWAAMQAWKAEEDRKTAERTAQQAALEKKRAEEARLAQAEQIAERARQTGNAKLAQAAVDILDKPLDIAPVQVSRTVPKLSGTGVKVVKRKVVVGKYAYQLAKQVADREKRQLTAQEWDDASVIKGRDYEELIISVAAQSLLERPELFPEEPNATIIRGFLMQFASKNAEPGALKGVDAAWIKREFANAGDTFKLGGVEVVLREGLG